MPDKHALVIDDQTEYEKVLSDLIQSLDQNWESTGYNTAQNAITAAEQQQPDLVLCDQTMPEMDGADCLNKIREIAPGSIRILMSGQLNKNTVVKTAAHQSLTKPITPENLKLAIHNTRQAQNGLSRTGLQNIVPALRSIPMLPSAYQQLRKELEEEYSSNEMIGEIIASDPGLSSRVLQLANSPAFGREILTADPSEAVMYLGRQTIETIALSQQIFKSYKNIGKCPVKVEEIWTYNWKVAGHARELGKTLGATQEQRDEAFLAGMLQDIGTLVLLDNCPEQTCAAWKVASQNQTSFQTELKNQLGGSGHELSYYILLLWGINSNTAEAVLTWNQPQTRKNQEVQSADLLYIANLETGNQNPCGYWQQTQPDTNRLEELNYTLCPPQKNKKAWWERVF